MWTVQLCVNWPWGSCPCGLRRCLLFFFFNDTAPTEIYTLSLHDALPISSPDAVDAAHAAGLARGGSDEGPPGPRPHYGDGYYGAYLRDPDGNKVHVVHRADVRP